MNVLIINLTRFGDLIQTQPVISGYRSLGCRVGLVCLENFAGAATLLEGVDALYPFPGAGLLSKLDDDWRLAVREATDFKKAVLSDFKPDKVINLTPSVACRILTHDLTPNEADVAGFTVDEFGFNADTSSWAAFLQMVGGSRGASPFNICDIFRRTAGLRDEGNSLELSRPDETALSRASEMLLSNAPEGGQGFVALQLGASEDRRRWPVAYFIQTAERLWQDEKLVAVLLGTKGEVDLGNRFTTVVRSPVINLMGQTSLPELAGVLVNCRGLITNDTGTMHLAAGLGVPLCAVFLATAQPWDTGPYREGNICLEPDLDCHPCEFGKSCQNELACRQVVRPDAMTGFFKSLIYSKTPESFSSVRAWKTHTGDDGFMALDSLSGHDSTDRALWIAIQRAHYLRFLDGDQLETPTGLGQHMEPETTEALSKTLTSASDILFLLSQQGMLLLKNPRPQAKSKFLASWQRLQTLLAGSKYLNILSLLWVFESQRCGDSISDLLDMTERYRALFASLLKEFV